MFVCLILGLFDCLFDCFFDCLFVPSRTTRCRPGKERKKSTSHGKEVIYNKVDNVEIVLIHPKEINRFNVFADFVG